MRKYFLFILILLFIASCRILKRSACSNPILEDTIYYKEEMTIVTDSIYTYEYDIREEISSDINTEARVGQDEFITETLEGRAGSRYSTNTEIITEIRYIISNNFFTADELLSGKIAYYIPDSIIQNQVFRTYMVLSLPNRKLKVEFSGYDNPYEDIDTSDVVVDDIKLGNTMNAKLLDPTNSFNITSIGDETKIQNYVPVYHGVQMEEGVFLGPNSLTTNDMVPRARTEQGDIQGQSDWQVSPIHISKDASIGAGAVIRQV